MSLFSSDVPPDRRFERDSTFASLEEIVEATQAYAARAFAEGDAAHRFVLAVSEAVSNAIEHGNASQPDKRIVVEFRADEAQVEARVTDEGQGFDPSAAVDDPLDEEHLTRTCGRGLYIIHEVAEAVHYEDEGRRVCMLFRREDASPDDTA